MQDLNLLRAVGAIAWIGRVTGRTADAGSSQQIGVAATASGCRRLASWTADTGWWLRVVDLGRFALTVIDSSGILAGRTADARRRHLGGEATRVAGLDVAVGTAVRGPGCTAARRTGWITFPSDDRAARATGQSPVAIPVHRRRGTACLARADRRLPRRTGRALRGADAVRLEIFGRAAHAPKEHVRPCAGHRTALTVGVSRLSRRAARRWWRSSRGGTRAARRVHRRTARRRIAAQPAAGATTPGDAPTQSTTFSALWRHFATRAAKGTVKRDRNVAQVTGCGRIVSVVIRYVVARQRRLVIAADILDVVSLKAIDDQRTGLSQLGRQSWVCRCP